MLSFCMGCRCPPMTRGTSLLGFTSMLCYASTYVNFTPRPGLALTGLATFASMSGMARTRITEERKSWRKNKPFGFHARPETGADGAMNIMKWKCFIPGKAKTDWEGGYFPLTIEFSEDYPSKPPKCKFAPNFFHPNIYPSGTVCLSILNEELLMDPNPKSPAQSDAYVMFTSRPDDYKRRVKAQTRAHPPPT